jgi:DNA-binding CsgD family transcriptional regulator
VARNRDLALLQLICSSGIDLMTQMPVISESLKRLVPSFSLSMIRVDASCAPREHYSEHFDEFSHHLFASSGHQFAVRTDDPAAFGNLLRNRRPYGMLIETPPAYLAGATYEHLFKRNGIHHVLDVALRERGRPLGILGIFREKGARPFTRSDVAVVSTLYDHLVHACAKEQSPARFDETDSAMILVDASGSIAWASPRARTWLEDATGGAERAMLMDRHILPEACRELCKTWQAVASAAGRDGAPAAAPTLALPVPGGRLRLRAYGLAPHEGEARGGVGYVGIQLSLEMHRGLRVLRALERSTLTAQQCRMALALWQGKRPAEIAGLLGVTSSTLKSYGKDLYGRLDVNSAAELVARLDEQATSVTLDLRRHLPRVSREGA